MSDFIWRRWRDSNSRGLLDPYRFSRADPSTTWVHLLVYSSTDSKDQERTVGENLDDFDVNGNGKPIGNHYIFEIVFSPRQHVFESRMMIEPLKITTLLGGFFYRRRFELPRFSRRPGENKALGENYRRELEDKFI